MKNATLKRIARLAGVHESTVSRAMSNSNLVNQETRDKIRKIASELGYFPNALARGLSLQKTNMIGVLIPDFMTSFYPEVLSSIERVAMRENYNLIFGLSHFDLEIEQRYITLFQERQVDGILAIGFHVNENMRLLEQLAKRGIQVVLIDSGFDHTPTNCSFHQVEIDNTLGSREAVNHLASLGHKNIAFITDSVTTPLRREGYKNACRDLKLGTAANLISVVEERREEGGYNATRQLLNKKVDFTAIFAANDAMAIGAIKALIDNGKRVPEDISVIGFDDIEIARYNSIPITTISQPKEELGAIAARILFDVIGQEKISYEHHIILKPTLVVRQSTGQCKGDSGKSKRK